jgi:hypothetical protein
VKACPNLEDLEYIYHDPPFDSFLDLLTSHSPKLKRFSTQGRLRSADVEKDFTLHFFFLRRFAFFVVNFFLFFFFFVSRAGDDGDTPCETCFTDDGMMRFLAGHKDLRELTLLHSGGISGKLFQHIGGLTQSLEKLEVERYCILCMYFISFHFSLRSYISLFPFYFLYQFLCLIFSLVGRISTAIWFPKSRTSILGVACARV